MGRWDMADEIRQIWHSYRERHYGLLGWEFTYGGTVLPLVCQREDEVVAVLIGPDPPDDPEPYREALRAFLAAKRISGMFVSFELAWVRSGNVLHKRDAIPVIPPIPHGREA